MKHIAISWLLFSAILFAWCASNNQPSNLTWGTQTWFATWTFSSWEAVNVTWVLWTSEKIEWKELIWPTSWNLYYILPWDKGASWEKIGCDDSLIKVETKLSWWNLWINLENLYKDLLKWNKKPANASNALEVSFIQVVDVKTSPKLIQINLSGVMWINGTCDLPRIKAQLENTVNQFKIPSEIRLNWRPLQDTLDSY